MRIAGLWSTVAHTSHEPTPRGRGRSVMYQACNATMGGQAGGVRIQKTRMVVSTRADAPREAPVRDETMTANTLSALRPAPSSSCLSRSSQRERLQKAILGTRIVIGAREAIY